MRNYHFLICLSIFLVPAKLLSQDQKMDRFQVSVNYLQVQNQDRTGSDLGIGLGLEYQFPLVKSIGLNGLGGLGYERLLDCSICYSEWFQNGYWLGIGLSKTFEVKEQKRFLAQLRYRRVGFERYEAGLIDTDGTVLRYGIADNPEEMFGFRVGYFLPVKIPLVLSYTYEWGNSHRMNSLLVGFQF